MPLNAAQKLRELLAKDLLIAPGAFDGLSARLVEQAGFKAIYASGGAIARSAGYPDLGLLSFTEVLARLQQMLEVTELPIIADADTGFGNAINTHRTIRAFERAGIAGAHLEDQVFPKRCGHLNDKRLVSCKEMQLKIRAAKEALQDENFLLIARTDAIAVEGFDAAIERALAYTEAGADMIFVEAPRTLEEIENIARLIPHPKLINMFIGGKTPLIPLEKLQALGYSLVIIPSDLQRAAILAMQTTLAAIKQDGDSQAVADKMVSFQDRERIVHAEDFLALDKK
jgi:2-methylisocitrate lyase-like PEP mutase family enzyme